MKPLRQLVTQGRVGTQTLHHPPTLINQACSLPPSLPPGCPAAVPVLSVWVRPRLPPTHPSSFLSSLCRFLGIYHLLMDTLQSEHLEESPPVTSFASLLVLKTGIQSQRRRWPSKVDVHLINLALKVFWPNDISSVCSCMGGGGGGGVCILITTWIYAKVNQQANVLTSTFWTPSLNNEISLEACDSSVWLTNNQRAGGVLVPDHRSSKNPALRCMWPHLSAHFREICSFTRQ